jgi:hypothetical protein
MTTERWVWGVKGGLHPLEWVLLMAILSPRNSWVGRRRFLHLFLWRVGGILHLLTLSRRLIHQYKLPYTSPIAFKGVCFLSCGFFLMLSQQLKQEEQKGWGKPLKQSWICRLVICNGCTMGHIIFKSMLVRGRKINEDGDIYLLGINNLISFWDGGGGEGWRNNNT